MRRALVLCLFLAACGGGGSDGEGAKLCGKSSIRGEKVGRVSAAAYGCGVRNAVAVRYVAGVRLSSPATLDCTTAKALEKWVRRTVKSTIGSRGGGVRELQVYGSYSCRPRNNVAGAKISEHGRGKAIDIGGFRLADGTTISVLSDWDRGRDGRILNRLHRAACGTFGTVLGPESDRYHANHFHLDTAKHGNGAYCR